jgi:5-methylcytosine-specific restriction protein A
VLDGEPLCRACSSKGITRPANQVDHINGDATNNDMNNLQPMCARCHSRKTATENGGWGRPKAGQAAAGGQGGGQTLEASPRDTSG